MHSGNSNGYQDHPAVSFLAGHTLNELIHAEQMATEYALLKAKRLNRTIALPEVNPLYRRPAPVLFRGGDGFCRRTVGY